MQLPQSRTAGCPERISKRMTAGSSGACHLASRTTPALPPPPPLLLLLLPPSERSSSRCALGPAKGFIMGSSDDRGAPSHPPPPPCHLAGSGRQRQGMLMATRHTAGSAGACWHVASITQRGPTASQVLGGDGFLCLQSAYPQRNLRHRRSCALWGWQGRQELKPDCLAETRL